MNMGGACATPVKPLAEADLEFLPLFEGVCALEGVCEFGLEPKLTDFFSVDLDLGLPEWSCFCSLVVDLPLPCCSIAFVLTTI